MKKLLGISLVAILTATPLMAGAATTEVTATEPVAASTEAEITAATTNVSPKYKLKAANSSTDGNAASAGYVKGAYNAAIKAINKVDSRIDTVASGKQDDLTAGDGIAIDDTTDTISVNLSKDGSNNNVSGLSFDSTNHTLEINKGNGMELDSTTHALQVKQGSGITVDSNGVSANVDNTTVEVGANGLQVKEITASNVANSALQTGNADNDKLTTKGYVDDQITTINTSISDMATTTGVTNTILNHTTLAQGAVTNGDFNGALASGTVLTVMTDWADDTTSSNVTAVTGIGTLATNVSVAAPTVSAVTYTETN